MKQNKLQKRIFFFPFILIICTALFNCKKEPLTVGKDLLPDSDKFDLYEDSIPVELYTINAIEREAQEPNNSPLGSLYDETFGNINASFINSIAPYMADDTLYNVIKENLTIVSARIQLAVDSSASNWGNGSNIPKFSVHEYKMPFPKKSYINLNIDNSEYGKDNLKQSISQSIINKRSQRIIFDIPHSFARKLISADTTAYASKILCDTCKNDDKYLNYRNHFKEISPILYFKSNEGPDGNHIVIKDIINNGTLGIDTSFISIEIEYDQKSKTDSITGTVKKELVYFLPTKSDYGGRIGTYEKDFSNEIEGVIDITTEGQSKVFLQSFVGPMGLIKIANLDSLRSAYSQSAIISDAKLILPTHTKDTIYKGMHLGLIDKADTSLLVDNILPESYFGGSYDEALGQFQFNIIQHMQTILNKTETYPGSNSIFVFPAKKKLDDYGTIYNHVAWDEIYRIILNGSASSSPPYIKIIYTIPKR